MKIKEFLPSAWLSILARLPTEMGGSSYRQERGGQLDSWLPLLIGLLVDALNASLAATSYWLLFEQFRGIAG